MTLVKVNNNNSILKPYSLFPEMKSLIDDFFFNDRYFRIPAVNISEDNEAFNLEFSIPGFKKENIKINIENNVITVSGEVSENNSTEEKNYSRREFTHQSFSRSFNLPENVNEDEISANYENGILNLRLPKIKEVKNNVKQITVN